METDTHSHISQPVEQCLQHLLISHISLPHLKRIIKLEHPQLAAEVALVVPAGHAAVGEHVGEVRAPQVEPLVTQRACVGAQAVMQLHVLRVREHLMQRCGHVALC